MGSNFRDRKHKVIAIEANGTTRSLISELLRERGFADVQAVPSIKEALAVLESEPVSWVLSSMFAEQDINLLQLLNMICRTPQLSSLRVSAFVDESELSLLPTAFEQGLLSYHLKPFNKEKLKNEFDNLLSDFEAKGWKSLNLSSAYLRKALTETGSFAELLNFEKQMTNLQQGNLNQLLNMALPLIKTKKIDEATSLLMQVQKLDPSLEKQVKQIFSTYLPTVDPSGAKNMINIMNLKSAVIVESDAAVQKDLSTALAEMGVEKVQVFSDGRSALEYLKVNVDNDLVIQEWKIPKVTGPIFLQKARDEGGQTAPFILYTSLTDQNDVQFLKEMGIACVMTKPTARHEIIKNIIWTIQQERSPTEKKALERKFREALEGKNLPEAKAIMQQYVANPGVSIGARLLMEAELAYSEADYEKARELAFGSLKNSGDSIFVLNLLGKTMMQLRDVATALKCFEKAQELAPQNLARLCQIAEIQTDLGQTDKAEKSLAMVNELDPSSERLQETRVKIAINTSADNARELMGQLKHAEHIVSYMNNLAVAMARCGKVEDGIEQYKKTMNAIPVHRQDLLCAVQFNLALAHLRANALPPAVEILAELAKVESRMQSKSAAILKRIKHAQASGTVLQFKESGLPQPAVSPSGDEKPLETAATDELEAKRSRNQAVASAMLGRPGDRCCFMIFQCTENPPQAIKMMKENLRFMQRVAIKKGEVG